MNRRHKEVRKESIKKRKNFLPTLIVTILLWLFLALIICFFNPDLIMSVLLFFAILFLALLFTCSIIFANGRRGLISAIGLTIFILLRYFGIGNILNFILIFGICTSVEFYSMRK